MSNGAPITISPAQRHPATGTGIPDPALTCRFLAKIGVDPIGQFQECSGLQVEYETLEWPEGGENTFVHKLRGRAKYPNLVLKCGITHRKGLIEWFRACASKPETARRDLMLELYAGDGEPVRRWSFTNAYPVKWTGPNLNAGQANAAIETLEIVHHGFREV